MCTIQACTSVRQYFMQSHITHIRRVCVQLYPATCPFVRMTRIFYRLLQSHRGETDTRIRFRTDSWPWGRKILPPFLPGLEPATFWSWVWCLTTELTLIPLGRTRSDAFSRVTCLCWLSAQYLTGCIYYSSARDQKSSNPAEFFLL